MMAYSPTTAACSIVKRPTVLWGGFPSVPQTLPSHIYRGKRAIDVRSEESLATNRYARSWPVCAGRQCQQHDTQNRTSASTFENHGPIDKTRPMRDIRASQLESESGP